MRRCFGCTCHSVKMQWVPQYVHVSHRRASFFSTCPGRIEGESSPLWQPWRIIVHTDQDQSTSALAFLLWAHVPTSKSLPADPRNTNKIAQLLHPILKNKRRTSIAPDMLWKGNVKSCICTPTDFFEEEDHVHIEGLICEEISFLFLGGRGHSATVAHVNWIRLPPRRAIISPNQPFKSSVVENHPLWKRRCYISVQL